MAVTLSWGPFSVGVLQTTGLLREVENEATDLGKRPYLGFVCWQSEL